MSSPRARDLGITIGRGAPGSSNTITDVAGVRVGHRTVIEGDDGDPRAVRTDATVRWIARHDGDAGESVMPCVTECDDSWLSNVLAEPIDDEDVWAALDAVTSDPVE